jgi:hypothetical protein
MKIFIHVEIDPSLAMVVTALLLTSLASLATPAISDMMPAHTVLPTLALGITLAIGQAHRQPRM